MPATPYNYPYSDFGSALPVPPHKVDIDRLTLEIQQSAIVIALDYINKNDGTQICTIVFKDPLSPGDETILDTIVANHNGEPLPNDIPQPVELYSDVGEPAPKTADGTNIFLPNLFPVNVFFYINGAGDGVATRGDGQQFNASRSTNGDTVVEWSYIDWVYAAGGGIFWQNGQVGDWASMQITAPASSVTPNGGGTGNCNLVPIPGGNLIVPAPGNGSYDVDLATAVPIPTYIEEGQPGTGYWEWSTPNTGSGTITPSPTPGQGAYNLFDFSRLLVRFVNRFQLVGTDRVNLTVPAIRPKRILPQWKLSVVLHNEAGGHDIVIQWYLMTARNTST